MSKRINAGDTGSVCLVIGPTGAFTEILADAGGGSQALDPEMSGERQCRDAVIELEREVIDAKCLSHK